MPLRLISAYLLWLWADGGSKLSLGIEGLWFITNSRSTFLQGFGLVEAEVACFLIVSNFGKV